MNSKERYRHAAYHTLAGFQLVEQSIKDYLDIYYKTVRSILPKELTFKYSINDLNDSSLTTLMKHFSKISDDKVLIKSINSLKHKRDDLAHRALLAIYEADKTDDHYEIAISSFNEVKIEIQNINKSLLTKRDELYDILGNQISKKELLIKALTK